jgi:hypothetical protein
VSTPDEVPTFELTPAQWSYIRTKALRAILAALDDDDDRRKVSVYGELTQLEREGQAVLFGVLGYFIARVAAGLKCGYGGTAEAIDATTAELAAVVIASEQS